MLPATTTRVTLTASDATTVRPRVAERDRLRCATNPGMPNTSKVAIDSAAAAANAPASTCTASPADPDPNIAANASCDDENAPAVPATPAKRPIGTPTAPSSSASASTVLRSCRFEAPREASSPNCRVRSATEMANAL